MTDWLLIAVVFATLVVFWQLLTLVFCMIETWYAAHRREDSQPNKERGRSGL